MTGQDPLVEALFALAEGGGRTPCQAPHRRGLWISDDHEARATAAAICTQLGCPVLAVCRAAGRGERFGVWGGVDVTERPGQKRRRAA